MPKTLAKFIFEEAFGSLMAHSIRALSSHLLRRGVELEVRIIPDTANAIPGSISFLRTTFRPKTRQGEKDRVIAYIFIHQYAGKHLARLCIAHEIYHILLEFNAYIDSERKCWPHIAIDGNVEEQCDIFANELCRRHDEFNKSEEARKEHLYFPDGIFKKPQNTRRINADWPAGFGLNPQSPFNKKPSFPE